MNVVIRGFNALQIPGFSVDLPGRYRRSAPAVQLPNIPLLARGGIVTRPTLAMVGEAGPEAVLPLGGRGAIEVRVFIGDTELKGIVRTEVRGENNQIAQTLLAGAV